MPDWSWFTVSFLTPFIFHYHLPLNLLNVISCTILAMVPPPPPMTRILWFVDFFVVKIQTIYTRGICIYTGSSQEIFLPRVRANISGKMQLLGVIANLFKIWKMHHHWNTPGKARVYRGKRPKNRLRLRTQDHKERRLTEQLGVFANFLYISI